MPATWPRPLHPGVVGHYSRLRRLSRVVAFGFWCCWRSCPVDEFSDCVCEAEQRLGLGGGHAAAFDVCKRAGVLQHLLDLIAEIVDLVGEVGHRVAPWSMSASTASGRNLRGPSGLPR